VSVAKPVRENVTDYLELTGNTQSVKSVQLRARVEGYLEKVLFKDGEKVKKGQPLFLIQQNTYMARLQQAEGNVLTQKALLDHAKTELDRYTGLYSQKAAAQTDVENWRFQRDSALAALMTAEAQRDLARLDLGYTAVTAPFDGRIDRRLADPGNLVGSGTSTVLAEITELDPLYVYFNVSETNIQHLMSKADEAPGKDGAGRLPVYMGLSNEEGYPHEGYLDFAATTVNSATGTLLMRGVFPNADGNMLPGQFGRVRLPIRVGRSALLAPQVAVGYDQVGTYVLMVNDKDVVERRNVKTGASKSSMVVIEDGLTGDEWVIVNGLLKAIPGRPVTPEREEAGQQPAAPAGSPQKEDQG
jgi:RND family efflux transporter MFP subunit